MLHVFTYGAGDINRFKNLRDSSSLSGLKINYITQNTWDGFYDKIKYLTKIIKDIPDDDIICFIDGFDVLAFSEEREILDKFFSFNCDIVVGAELNCWPGEYLTRYKPSIQATNYRYLNSGGYIGYKRAVYSLLTWKSDSEIQWLCRNGSDQAYFKEYYYAFSGNGSILLDIQQKIFQNMFSVDWNELQITNGRVLNKILGTKPCFLHFNGDSWKTNDHLDIMPILVDLCSKGGDRDITQKQNFNSAYFKRNQI